METSARFAASVAARSCVRFSSPVCVIPPVNSTIAFLSGNSAQHVRKAFDGCELLVRIEHVEFGFIRRVRRAGIFLDVVFAIGRRGIERTREVRGIVRRQLRDRFVQDGAIVREIREDVYARRENDDGDHVGLGHLLLHEFVGRIVRANQVVRLHRSEIEEQHDQAAVAQRVADRVRGRRIRTFVINRHDDRLVVRRPSRFRLLRCRRRKKR